MFNALNHDYTADLRYPIRIVYDNERLIPTSRLPSFIELNATGYGWNFLRKSLQINQKAIYIKPSALPRKNYITSEEIFPLFNEQLSDIKINYFLKDTLFLNFDYSLRKKIYLKADTHHLSIAPKHKIIGKIELSPEYLYCYGAASRIKALPDTFIVRLPYENIKGEFEESIQVDTFDKTVLKLNHAEVLVKFEAREVIRKKKRVKLIKENFPQGYKLTEDSILLGYYVAPDADESTEGSFIVVANFKQRNKNSIRPEVLAFPDYVQEIIPPESLTLRKIAGK